MESRRQITGNEKNATDQGPIEHQIWWNAGQRKIYFWHDNWNGMDDLYNIVNENAEWNDSYKTIKGLTKNNKWDVEILQQLIPMEVTECTNHNIKPPRVEGLTYKPCWMLPTKVNFTIAWQYIRHRGDK